ncbi:E3 UFM1-protein ligase 1 homolog isoform X2 [Amborella trichopoda]|uniref:E3 UFM1-protein ligase 1 homolog isoform X2 n=1 Tax=Amborella trichopoda TaxID=13333 RepID=UPI0009BDAD24|nr:E3 UFM1-protein ligase 1 homolog isoform X2 [Amborella trichopoda]|eukprot:XP_020526681.1 E3 UFM1-protein ligase 1 homolog isoform X2 [Amborella trichopoda]
MDEELLELQRQFEAAQQAKSSVRLSERNVVELVRKLQELNIIDYELLHTISGKEYITLERLRAEMEMEINKVGRVSLIDLTDMIDVDLYHIELQAQYIVGNNPGLMLVQGEIIAQSYWDTVAEEINERLQECSQIALAELATQLQVGSELLSSILEPRLGTLVMGRLEGGQIYTPLYIARVTAMVRGAARGVTVPTNLSAVWSRLHQLLQVTDGATGVFVEGSFFQSLFNGLVKDGEILGSLRAGVNWTPALFALAQSESVESFFSQNSFINYDVLHKLSIPHPRQYLQVRYPEGILLETVFIHSSMIEMLNVSTEDAIEHDSWVDSVSVLPSSFGIQDAAQLLLLSPFVQSAVKCGKAIVVGETCISSTKFISDVFALMVKETENFIQARLVSRIQPQTVNEASSRRDSSQRLKFPETSCDMDLSKQAEKESKKRRGKQLGPVKTAAVENFPQNQDNSSTKTKKKNKDNHSFQVSGARKDDKIKESELDIISEDWIAERILQCSSQIKALEGLDDEYAFIRSLAIYLRPLLVTSWRQKRHTSIMVNAESRRRLLDSLQRKLDEAYLDFQLYEKGLELFEDDHTTSVVLHKHLLRTTATPIMDMLLHDLDLHNKMSIGGEVEEHPKPESTMMSSEERISLAKSLPGSLSTKVLQALEALEGKQVNPLVIALKAMTEECGLLLKKLDKKLERTLLHSYRKDLTSLVDNETDPVALLPKVVSLLHLQVHNKIIQAPGRAISAAIFRLKDKLEESAYNVLMDYHAKTVSHLSLLSAANGDLLTCVNDWSWP